MKLKCPSCSTQSLSILKVMIADLFGWAVRCGSCQKRISHSGRIRCVLRLVFISGIASSTAIAAYPDQRFHAFRFFVGVLIVAIVFVAVAIPALLFVRDEILKTNQMVELRRVSMILLKLYSVFIIVGVLFYRETALEFIGFLSYIAFFFCLIFTGSLLKINWTI